jgi:hypothetical protein
MQLFIELQRMGNMITRFNELGVDRWEEEQLFEEDVRAVLMMLRPHRRERLLGWSEYRTGGKNFRATISWDKDFERTDRLADDATVVPRMADVLETILIGSVKRQDELDPHDEFGIYRGIVEELYRRVLDAESCYD